MVSDIAKKRALVTQIVTLTMNPALDISTSVDKVVPTHKLRCSEEKIQPGGGGINISRVVRRLGTQTTAIYPSGGFTGELLTELLEKEGVKSQGITIKQETRECFTVHETSSRQDFRFLLPGPTLSLAEQQACADAFDQQSSSARYMVASGSLPPGVSESFYARLARHAKERTGASLWLWHGERGGRRHERRLKSVRAYRPTPALPTGSNHSAVTLGPV